MITEISSSIPCHFAGRTLSVKLKILIYFVISEQTCLNHSTDIDRDVAGTNGHSVEGEDLKLPGNIMNDSSLCSNGHQLGP